MPLEERAKIFLPFAALKGYEQTVEQRTILFEKESFVLDGGTYERITAMDVSDRYRIIDELGEKYPDDFVWLFEAAQYHARKCEYDKAIALYERSFALETRRPRFQDELMAIAEIAEIRGDFRKAAETYDRIIDLLENEWHMTEEVELQHAKREKVRLLAKGEKA